MKSPDPFKPMLAASFDIMQPNAYEKLSYPLLASAKLDGIRCVVRNGQILSRSLKPIPNKYVQAVLGDADLEGMDGELMVEGTFQDVTSSIMKHTGEPKFIYQVFDWFGEPEMIYAERVLHYQQHAGRPPFVKPLAVKMCKSPEDLDAAVGLWLNQGYEGAIVRSPFGEYKFGRSTVREGGMIKIKPFEDAEAKVVGFEEQMANLNEKTTNELGRSKRSSCKANKEGKDTLGALVVKSEEFGVFNVGTGMDDALRQLIWNNKRKHMGAIVKFRFQRIGSKNKPRIPVFLGFRSKLDL